MTVLEVPTGSVIPGPEQISNTFNSTDVISSYITLQGRNGSTVIHGNLLTLPIGKSFLYVEPLYVQAQTNGYPLLRRIMVSYGGKIGFGETLEGALSDLQPGHVTGQTIDSASDQSPSPSSSSPAASRSAPAPSTSRTQPATTEQQVINDLSAAVTELNAAYDTHDPQKISDAQAKVLKLAGQLQELQASSSAGASPRSSPTASPTKTGR
jgi:uncharacterized membrane protein (UPF0182 family)